MTPPVLVATVAAVGVLHTLVPDHWAPIVVVGRQRGWSVAHTARAAAVAGLGHVTSTLVLGIIVWTVGASLSVSYGHAVSVVAAAALILFGAWIGYTGWREVRADHDHGHPTTGHAHLHSHGDVAAHAHWHAHQDQHLHAVDGGAAVVHDHGHAVAGRTALLLILGSSPMIEGLPAFFAASTYGPALLGVMAAVFAVSTIATYVITSGFAMAGLQRISFGPLERYGEVLSGAVVALVGIYALITA